MSENGDLTRTAQSVAFANVGCVGILFLLIMALVVVQERRESRQLEAEEPIILLISPSATYIPTDTPTATHTLVPTMTATAVESTQTATTIAIVLPSATETSTPTPIPSATPTTIPTATATYTPTPTATPTATPIPLPTPNGQPVEPLRVPILMYHYVSEPPADADIYRQDLSVSPEQFRDHMQTLSEAGYTTIDFYQLSRAVAGVQTLPPNPIIITLDDGYLDNYQNAYPVLREFGMKATFFLTTGPLDVQNPNYMNWDNVIEMARAGMRFEAHSVTHPDLRLLDEAKMVEQILKSHQRIQDNVGYRPRYFAYPSGRFNDEIIDVLKENDFWGAVTTNGGDYHTFENRYTWDRLRIRNTTSTYWLLKLANGEWIDLINN